MDIVIKKLTPELCEDFIYFFDNTAFSDHEEWVECFCLESHISHEEDARLEGKADVRRELARELVMSGVMNGYLVYDCGDVVGWCNCDDKMNYAPICSNSSLMRGDENPGMIKSVYCFDIAPAYRGRGIAHLMLDRVCEDAKSDGYSFVEVYPYADIEEKYQYRGPIRLYEKHGFEMLCRGDWLCVMRKEL